MQSTDVGCIQLASLYIEYYLTMSFHPANMQPYKFSICISLVIFMQSMWSQGAWTMPMPRTSHHHHHSCSKILAICRVSCCARAWLCATCFGWQVSWFSYPNSSRNGLVDTASHPPTFKKTRFCFFSSFASEKVYEKVYQTNLKKVALTRAKIETRSWLWQLKSGRRIHLSSEYWQTATQLI